MTSSEVTAVLLEKTTLPRDVISLIIEKRAFFDIHYIYDDGNGDFFRIDEKGRVVYLLWKETAWEDGFEDNPIYPPRSSNPYTPADVERWEKPECMRD